MTRKRYETVVRADVQKVWRFHSNVSALVLLTPPNRRLRFDPAEIEVTDGATHRLKFGLGPFWMQWDAVISDVVAPARFRDTAIKCPFKSWTHLHEFVEHEGGTKITDTIEYEPPFGIFGGLLDKLIISKQLDQLFAFRHMITHQQLS
ncbi:MAG: SRPBCC family protein [Fimbriimonadaceae bacterium]